MRRLFCLFLVLATAQPLAADYGGPEEPPAPRPQPRAERPEDSPPSPETRETRTISTNRIRISNDIRIMHMLFEETWNPTTNESVRRSGRLRDSPFVNVRFSLSGQPDGPKGVFVFKRNGVLVMTLNGRDYRGEWGLNRGRLTVTLPNLDDGKPRSGRVTRVIETTTDGINERIEWSGFELTPVGSKVRSP